MTVTITTSGELTSRQLEDNNDHSAYRITVKNEGDNAAEALHYGVMLIDPSGAEYKGDKMTLHPKGGLIERLKPDDAEVLEFMIVTDGVPIGDWKVAMQWRFFEPTLQESSADFKVVEG